MYSGIVFSNYQTKAFLSMAAREGLICEKGETDGVFNKLTRAIVPNTKSMAIREQLCVAGTVYIDPFIYRCMDGELIQNGIIRPYVKPETNLFESIIFDVDTIQELLEEKGYDIKYYTVETIHKAFEEWKEKCEEFNKYTIEQHNHYKGVEFLKLLGLSPKESYDEAGYEHYINLKNAVFSSPLLDVVKEYENLLAVAFNNNLLSPMGTTIITPEILNSNRILPNKKVETAISIVKYTSKKLDRIYTGSSITDCIKLLDTDESKAFRRKIDELIVATSEQDANKIEKIDKEIEKAKNAMKAKRCVEVLGTVCTVAAIAGTFVIPYLEPELTQLGASISNAATILGPLALCNPMRAHEYLWASYGIYKDR